MAEGEQGADFSVIDSGKASARRERDLPRPRKLGTLQVGDFFGEISFLMKAARSATVRAETDCTAFRFPSSEFEELLRKHANMRKWVNTVVRERLIGLQRSLAGDLRSSPSPDRGNCVSMNSSFARESEMHGNAIACAGRGSVQKEGVEEVLDEHGEVGRVSPL